VKLVGDDDVRAFNYFLTGKEVLKDDKEKIGGGAAEDPYSDGEEASNSLIPMSERYRDRTQVNDSKLSRNGGQGAANG
jgi:hypothetical protein